MEVKTYQRYFGSELITVLSTSLFKRGPVVQTWHGSDSKDFYKVVKIGSQWLRLEAHEDVSIGRFIEWKGKPRVVVIQILDKIDSGKIVAEARVTNPQQQ